MRIVALVSLLVGLGLTVSSFAMAAESNEADDFSLQLDNGLGISPRNFFGVGVGYTLSDLLHVDAGLSLAGARVNVLGQAYNVDVRVGRRFYGVFGNTIYSGSGRIPIAFTKTYYEMNDSSTSSSSDTTVDHCSSVECDSEPVQGERQAKWTIIYGNVGAGYNFGGKHVRWFVETGFSAVASYSLHIEEMANDKYYGDVQGPVVDHSQFLAPAIVSKNDSGPYLRIGMNIFLF